MDFHALSRRDLQALSKRNGVKANQTNAAMADALAELPKVDGIEEYVQPASAAKPVVQTVVEEEETAAEEEEAEEGEKEAAAAKEERVALTPDEVIVLDDDEEEEEKAPALYVGRRRATRRAPVEPVVAPPAASKRAAARKTEKGDAAAEAVPDRATRGRSQRTVAEEEAPKAARRASRRAVARNTSTEQEEQEKGTQAASSDEGDDAAEDLEAVTDAQNEEQFAAAEAQKEETAAEAVPARTTRGRSHRTVVSVAEDEAPRARRTSRRAAARKTGTEQEEEAEGTKGGVSDVEAAVPAPASSGEGDDGAAKMEAAINAQSEEQCAASEAEKRDASAEVVPARATRAGSRRKVVSFVEEAAPKTRRTSRRAVARKTGTEQEEEKMGTNGDVSDMETAAPAPVSSDKRDDGAEVSEVAANAHNGEQNEPVEQPVEAEPRLAVPVRTTRARSKKKVVSFADEEAPKSRRTSTTAVAWKTSTEQEEEEKGTQGYVSYMGAAVRAPASSDEARDGAEEIEATTDTQNEEQVAAAETLPARATRARSQRKVVSVAEKEAPESRRTSRRTGTMQEKEVQDQQQQDIASNAEAAVPPPVSSDVASEAAEEMEADMEFQNEEQDEIIEEQREEDEGVVADTTPLLEEEETVAEDCPVDSSVEDPVAEDCPLDSSVEEQTDTISSEEIQHSSEDTEMVPVQEVLTPKSGEAAKEVDFTVDVGEENEDCTVEEETPVAEHVDSSVQEPLVDVQQCEATEEIHLEGEDTEMVPVNKVQQATLASDEVTEEVDFTSVVDHASEENEDCTAEEEPPVVDVQQYEDEVPQATLTSGEATDEVDVTSDADHDSEENEDCTVEEETPVADDVDPAVQELEVEVQQSDADEENELLPTDEDFAAKASEKKQDIAADEVTQNTDVAAEEETVHASEENEVPNSEEVLQGAAKANEKKEDIAAEEERLVATDDNLSQATATDNVKESDFSCDLADVFLEEGVVAEDCAADSSVEEQHDTVPSEEIQPSSDDTEMVPAPLSTLISGENAVQSAAKANKEKEDMVAVEVQQWSEAMYEEVVEVVTVDKDESGFIADLTDVFMGEEAAVTADEMPQSSVTMEENVEKMVTVENLPQVTVTDDEWAVTLGAWLENLSRAKVTEDEGAAKEVVTMEENVEEMVTVDNLPQVTATDDEWAVTLGAWLENLSRAKVTEDEGAAKEVVTVDNLSQATLTDVEYLEESTVENLSQTKESGVTGYLQPAFDAARDFSGHIASPLYANVFEDATKYLSMDSVTVKPMVSEPMSVQVKVAKKPEAMGSLSRRRLKMKLKADDGPLCIYSNSGDENNTSEAQESETLGSLSLRKLRTEFNEIVAVAQENEVQEGKKSSVPLDTLSLRKLRLKLRETLNAQKIREPTRVALGRLDENAY